MVIAHPPVVVHATAAASAHVSRADPAPHGWVKHVVRPGETVAHLAVRYRSSISALVARNDLAGGGSLIAPGQRILVPRAAAAPRTGKATTHSRTTSGSYRVRDGDTLFDIAVRHHTTVARLAKLNRISPTSFIHAGQRLSVPGAVTSTKAGATARTKATPRASTASAARRHTVRAGDTVFGLALRYRISVAAIHKANGLTGSMIYPGQSLRIPGAAAAAGKGRKAPTSKNRKNTFAGRTYSDKVVTSAERNREALAAMGVPSRSATRELIVRTARRHGVDPKLALAISWQESGWNQRQVSVANAIGAMQVIPMAGDWASALHGRRLDLRKTEDNVTAGVVILRALTRAAENRDQAIAAYYQGLASVRAHGMYSDTRQYVRNVNYFRSRM